MALPPDNSHATAVDSAGSVRELGGTSRIVGVVLWTSFLAAAFATTICFGLFDPAVLEETSIGDDLRTHRLMMYAAGFFFFWLICIAAAGLTALMLRTDHAPDPIDRSRS